MTLCQAWHEPGRLPLAPLERPPPGFLRGWSLLQVLRHDHLRGGVVDLPKSAAARRYGRGRSDGQVPGSVDLADWFWWNEDGMQFSPLFQIFDVG